ncbi:MAG: hypothetical protein WCD37_15405 [Chloroflexia bacterium]
MKHKDKEYEQARALREQGYSIREICKLVDAAKGTISVWIRDIPLSQEQLQRLNDNRVVGRERARATVLAKREMRIAKYYEEADNEYRVLSQDSGFMFGLALYIGEGYKGSNPEVGFINWNPQVVLKALEFFTRIGIPKSSIKCRITLHPAQDRREAEAFWSSTLGIPPTQFNQTYQAISPGSRGKRGQKWPHGGCTIRAYSAILRHKLNRWMELSLADTNINGPVAQR